VESGTALTTSASTETLPEEHRLEKIIAGPNEKGKYLVKWEGWTKEHNTWEPADHISTEDLQEHERLQALKACDSDDDHIPFSDQLRTQRLEGS